MKKFSFSLFLAMMALMVCAAPITKQQAREKAQSFLNLRGKQVVSEARRAPGVTSTDSNQPLYVFNATDNKGFVIIAGDDRAETVLGYSETGSFNEDNLPDNFRSWLLMTAEEIKALPSSPKMQTAAPRKVAIHSAIKPLIKTQWSQGRATETGYIYNTLTPTINVTVDEYTTVPLHCITGCVATAGAQLMYYYKHPQDATQQVPGYTPNNTIGAVQGLDPIQFNWDEMKENYSSSDVGTASEKAVSELMLYCGYAAHMNYGLEGSGSSEYTLVNNMVEYFDYDPSWKYISRSSYSISEWDAVIYGELKAGRPIIVSGQGNNGGHAFICDGYDGAGLYHFNWGWGGQYDGYFKLNDTNPYQGGKVYSDGTIDTGYILDVTAIIGIQPNTGQGSTGNDDDNDTWDEPTTEGIVARAMNPQLEGTVISAKLQNPNSEAAYLALGIGEMNANGTITPVDTKYEGYKNSNLPAGYNFTSILTFDVSTPTYNLSDGTHQLVFISIANDDTEWVRCQPTNIYYEVKVEGGQVVSVIQHPVINLQASDLAITGTLQPGSNQKLSFKVTNLGDNYRGSLYLFASTTEEKGSYRNSLEIAIKNGNTKERTMSFWPSEAGTYNVWLCTDYNGTNVIGQTTVKIAQELEVTKIDFTGNKYANVVQPVKVTVCNKHGDFNQPLFFFASTSDSNKGNAVYSVSSAIEEGKSEDFTLYFKPSEAGTYTVWVCTDQAGTNVIGSAQVEISPVPDYEVTLTKVSLDVDAKPTGTAILCVENNTEHNFYDRFMARLYIKTSDNYYESIKDVYSDYYVISAGETASITIPLTNLKVDATYLVLISYKPKVDGNYDELCRTVFTVTEPEYEMGDVNHDGRVNVTDVMMLVNHILKKPVSNFDENLADINKDNKITVTDVMLIVNAILQ